MKKSHKTIILVADVRGWAFDSIAKYIKTILNDEYDIHIIYTSDFSNHEALLKGLAQYNKIDFIHFFYRGYLDDLLKFIAKKYHDFDNHMLNKFLVAATTTNVPEHLFIKNEREIADKLYAFLFVDNYYPVSQKLYDIYSNIPSYPKPWKVIYDNIIFPTTAPNFQKHDQELVVTWVGNSSWGEWQLGIGFDSKGYKSVIEPVFNILEKENIEVKQYIIDGNIKKRSAEEVFKILEETDILLIGAKSEGTPLPLIEAMSHGCAVITTDVGIASEVLPPISQEFIIHGKKTIESREDYLIFSNPYDFISAIKRLHSNRDLLSEIKRQNYEAYLKIFCDKKHFINLWSSLIENSIEKLLGSNRILEKKKILEEIRNNQSKRYLGCIKDWFKSITTNFYVKKSIKYLLTYRIINFLAKRVMKFFG